MDLNLKQNTDSEVSFLSLNTWFLFLRKQKECNRLRARRTGNSDEIKSHSRGFPKVPFIIIITLGRESWDLVALIYAMHGLHTLSEKNRLGKDYVLSGVWLFATPWTVAHHTPLSMEFSGQEYWSELPFPSSGDLPDPRIEPGLLHCRHLLYRLSHQGRPSPRISSHFSKESWFLLHEKCSQKPRSGGWECLLWLRCSCF